MTHKVTDENLPAYMRLNYRKFEHGIKAYIRRWLGIDLTDQAILDQHNELLWQKTILNTVMTGEYNTDEFIKHRIHDEE